MLFTRSQLNRFYSLQNPHNYTYGTKGYFNTLSGSLGLRRDFEISCCASSEVNNIYFDDFFKYDDINIASLESSIPLGFILPVYEFKDLVNRNSLYYSRKNNCFFDNKISFLTGQYYFNINDDEENKNKHKIYSYPKDYDDDGWELENNYIGRYEEFKKDYKFLNSFKEYDLTGSFSLNENRCGFNEFTSCHLLSKDNKNNVVLKPKFEGIEKSIYTRMPNGKISKPSSVSVQNLVALNNYTLSHFNYENLNDCEFFYVYFGYKLKRANLVKIYSAYEDSRLPFDVFGLKDDYVYKDYKTFDNFSSDLKPYLNRVKNYYPFCFINSFPVSIINNSLDDEVAYDEFLSNKYYYANLPEILSFSKLSDEKRDKFFDAFLFDNDILFSCLENSKYFFKDFKSAYDCYNKTLNYIFDVISNILHSNEKIAYKGNFVVDIVGLRTNYKRDKDLFHKFEFSSLKSANPTFKTIEELKELKDLKEFEKCLFLK